MYKEEVYPIEVAWKECVTHKQINEDVVNHIVSRSWSRCLENNLNPYKLKKKRLTDNQLQKALARKRQLIHVAKPFMEKIYQFVAGSGFVVVLLDNDCNILELVGDKNVISSHDHLAIGENWSEEFKGTNAMGTVLMEKEPLQIYAQEHFCKMNHGLTCSAAPIMNADKQLEGILDISGDYRQVHAHTLGMVVSAVAAIEKQLELELANENIIYAYEQLNAVVDAMSDGLISFDKKGEIIKINAPANQILGLKKDAALGKTLKQVFQTDFITKTILKDLEMLNDYEVFVDTPSGQQQITLSARAIKGPYGKISGGVMTITEIKQIRKLVTRMTGAQASFSFDDAIGNSQAFKKVVELAKQTVSSNSSVMLYGESGTGKEVFAQAIHNQSTCANGPFIAVNCAAMPRELIQSELFGYEEGAFTGAKKGGRPGKFELANGGTIFLDEIGDMPLEVQAILLRVLQEKRINRLGSIRSIPVDCRIIAATNKDLYKQITRGYFRLDLFYRLNVITITIPPLRKRKEDILQLSKHFLTNFSRQFNREDMSLSPEVESILLRYWWPGNVRELQNAMERAVNVCPGKVIEPEYLPEKLQRVSDEKQHDSQPALSLEEAEKQTIMRALYFYRGNITSAAGVLGIGRNTLYRKLKSYGIDLQELNEEFKNP